MSLSAEVIIAIVTLLVTCPPALFVIWKIYLRHKRCQECYTRDMTYQRTTPSSASYPSSHDGILHCLYLERRVHTRALLFGAQIGMNPRDIPQTFYATLIDYRSRSNLQSHSGRSGISTPIVGHASAPPVDVRKFG
ncbi:hypothetical protein V2W45_1346229 [Cenococcum geophilum]